MDIKFAKQNKFPLIDRYSKIFETNKDTVFAYKNTIYADVKLSTDIILHEATHLKRQNKIGVDAWVEAYLTNPEFLIQEELIAYHNQLLSFPDRNERYKMKLHFADVLSSSLYGSVITRDEALKKL